MKKYLLSLLCLLGAGLTAGAEGTWTYDVTSDYSTLTWLNLVKSADKNANISPTSHTGDINQINWDYSYTGTGNTPSKDGNAPKGITMGSASSPFSTVTFSTNGFSGRIIKKVSVKIASVSKKCSYNVSLNAGDFSEEKEQVLYQNNSGSANTAGEAVFTPNTSCSNLAFTITQKGTTTNTTGGFKFCAVSVEYDDPSGPIDPSFSNVPIRGTEEYEYDLTIGETKGLPSISPANLTYSFSTDNTGIIEIDNAAKTIKAIGLGSATVNFTTQATEMYNAGSGSFEVTVNGKEPKMSFFPQVEYGKLGTGVVWHEVTIEEPADNHGAITYSSSDPEVVTVNSSTGQITPDDIKKAGTAVITATMAAEGDYAEGSASYKIIVIDPNAAIQPDNTVFDFTEVNPYGMTTQTGSSYETKVKSISGENNTVKITFGGNYRSWKENNLYYLRMQKNSTLKVEVPEGYKITKIGMTGTINSGASWSPTSGTVTDSSDPDGGTFSYIWVPANDTDVQREVTFSAGSSDVSKINKINVMYDAASSDLKSANLTFTPNVNGIIVNEEFTINAVNNPFNRVVTYSIEGLEDTEYQITEDGDNLKVNVSVPGSYTLKAISAPDNEYRDGFAIMRLNVFRHLAVYSDGETLTEDALKTDVASTLTFDVPANANLYYRIVSDSPAPITYADGDVDENQEAGFNLYDESINIPAKTSGNLEFYIANYGYKSPKRQIALSFTTGVEEIEGVEEAPARYYDLNGREVKGDKLDSGVYIRLQGGKAEKVLVK